MTRARKPKLKRSSRTLWLNGLGGFVAVAMALLGTPIIQQYPRLAAGLTAGLAAANYGLRFLTSEPLK